MLLHIVLGIAVIVCFLLVVRKNQIAVKKARGKAIPWTDLPLDAPFFVEGCVGVFWVIRVEGEQGIILTHLFVRGLPPLSGQSVPPSPEQIVGASVKISKLLTSDVRLIRL